MSINKTSFQYYGFFFLFPFIPVLDLQCIYEYLCQLLGQNTNGIEEFCQFDFGYFEHPDISEVFFPSINILIYLIYRHIDGV